jgi:phosphate uptake regulator
MADSAENIANEVLGLKDREMISDTILNDIAKFSTQVTKLSEQSFKAFLVGEIKLANEAVEMVETAENDERRLTLKVLTYVKDATVAASLRIIIRSLGQIAKYCRTIGEVTINRIMEKPSEMCEYVPVQ